MSAKVDPATATAEDIHRSKKRESPESTAVVDENPKIPVEIDDVSEEESAVRFLGEPVADEEARKRWPHRYQKTSGTVHGCCLNFHMRLIVLGFACYMGVCVLHKILSMRRLDEFCLFMVV